MASTRADIESLGWQFVADQDGYVRAEKYTASGELVTFAGDFDYKVIEAVDAWENYPVQAPGTRGVPEPDAPEAPAEEPSSDITA